MEVQEAIGTRRTYRYLLPYKPVELAKIQKMLEAARIASHWGNVQALKAVVVERATASKEVLESLAAPVAGFQIDQAPVVIVWWLDFAALDDQPNRLRELVNARVLGIDHEKASNALESFLIPFFEKVMPILKESGLTEMDCGQGIAQATLVAIDQGLGTACLSTAKEADIKQNLDLPETAKVLVLQCVGYPAESIEAGGQRPRRPFESLFSLNSVNDPFPRQETVVEELKQSRLIQPGAPLPWRQEELTYLQKALDLPDF
ncbi:MAG: nitroreductase family protein [Deltaproteobacteria bacterium]|nr:nitroreductase family protein [Deltaproteobacteria bacterium]MBW2397412.1 nitroreductase family protein [Deltaproteobacteria bacterium]